MPAMSVSSFAHSLADPDRLVTTRYGEFVPRQLTAQFHRPRDYPSKIVNGPLARAVAW